MLSIGLLLPAPNAHALRALQTHNNSGLKEELSGRLQGKPKSPSKTNTSGLEEVLLRRISDDGAVLEVYGQEGYGVVHKIPRQYSEAEARDRGIPLALEGVRNGLELAQRALGDMVLPTVRLENVRLRIGNSFQDAAFTLAQGRVPREQFLDQIVASLVRQGDRPALARLDKIFVDFKAFQDELNNRGVVHLDTRLSNYILDESGKIWLADSRLLTDKPSDWDIHTYQAKDFSNSFNHILAQQGKRALFRGRSVPDEIFGDYDARKNLAREMEARREASTGRILPRPNARLEPMFRDESRRAALEAEARKAIVEVGSDGLEETPTQLVDYQGNMYLFDSLNSRDASQSRIYRGRNGDQEVVLKILRLEEPEDVQFIPLLIWLLDRLRQMGIPLVETELVPLQSGQWGLRAPYLPDDLEKQADSLQTRDDIRYGEAVNRINREATEILAEIDRITRQMTRQIVGLADRRYSMTGEFEPRRHLANFRFRNGKIVDVDPIDFEAMVSALKRTAGDIRSTDPRDYFPGFFELPAARTYDSVRDGPPVLQAPATAVPARGIPVLLEGQIRDASAEFEEKGGWKLHLDVSPENYETVHRWFWNETAAGYKHHNATRERGAGFTVYVGSKREADALARRISGELSALLAQPSWRIRETDVQLAPNVWARFDINGKFPDLTDYGSHGVPHLSVDTSLQGRLRSRKLYPPNPGDKARADAELRELEPTMPERGFQYLAAQRGEYFTGGVTRYQDLAPAGLEELEDAGAGFLEPLLAASPDFSGLVQLREQVRRLETPVQTRLLQRLEEIERAPALPERWIAIRNWNNDLNRLVLNPRNQVSLLDPQFPKGGGVELKVQTYKLRSPEAVEWRKMKDVQFPVVYYDRLSTQHAISLPTGIVLFAPKQWPSVEEARRRLENARAGEPEDLRDSILLASFPNPERLSPASVELALQEEFRHFQMQNRVIPQLIEWAAEGRGVSIAEAIDLFGLLPDSMIARGLANAYPDRGTFPVNEIYQAFIFSAEATAILEAFRAGSELAGLSIYDALFIYYNLHDGIGGLSLEFEAGPIPFNAPWQWLRPMAVTEVLTELNEIHQGRTGTGSETAFRQMLLGARFDELRGLAKLLWEKTLRADVFPYDNPVRPAAGLEELDPAVKTALNRLVMYPEDTVGNRVTELEIRLSNFTEDQRVQFVQNLIWYSNRPEIQELLADVFWVEEGGPGADVRAALLDGIQHDSTGQALDAFETLFSQLPLEVMEGVFHRLLGSINENKQLRELLQSTTGLISRELASEDSKRMSGRTSSAGAGRGRFLPEETAPVPATLEEMNEVLFQEIEAGIQGHWREGWQRQGPSLALALEHAFIFAIVREEARVQTLDEVREGFLYGRLNEVARERVWLSRSGHPPELPTETAEIEDGFSEFYGLIAHRLLTRGTIGVGREVEFPSEEAEEAHRLFLRLRHTLRGISTKTRNRFLRHRVLERLVELEDDYASYLSSLASFKQRDHRFIETAQDALDELQKEFQVKRGLGRFRAETRRKLGLLEPPPALGGLEEKEVHSLRLDNRALRSYEVLLRAVGESMAGNPLDREFLDHFFHADLQRDPSDLAVVPPVRISQSQKPLAAPQRILLMELDKGSFEERKAARFLTNTEQGPGEASELLILKVQNLPETTPVVFEDRVEAMFHRSEEGVLHISFFFQDQESMATHLPAALAVAAYFLKEELPADGLEELVNDTRSLIATPTSVLSVPATVSSQQGKVVTLPSRDSRDKMFLKDSTGNAFFVWVTGNPVSIDRKTGHSSAKVQLRLFSFNPITAERLKALQDQFEFRVAQADREGLHRSEWKKLDRLQEALGVQFEDEEQNEYNAAAEFTLEGWWDVNPDSPTASIIPASIFIEVRQKPPPLPGLPEANSPAALPAPDQAGLEEGTDLEDLLASARIVERKAGSETVPMLQLSDPVRLPADDRWWEIVENATQGLRVIAGVASNERVVPSEDVGPILVLRMEQGRVRIYQPTAGMQLIGSVEPGGKKIMVGSGSRPGQGRIEGLATEDAIYSGRHFSVRWEGQEIVIEDEGSDGGTYLLENEISEILDAVEEQNAETTPGVELVVRKGEVVTAPNRLHELREWIASLGIPLMTRRQTRQLYYGETVVTREGERYRLAVLRNPSASPEKLSGRVVFVQKGIFSSDVLDALKQKNGATGKEEDVFEVDATDADLIVRILDQLTPTSTDPSAQKVPKPILITTPDSDLEQQVRSRHAARQRDLPAEWRLPLTLVSAPSEIAIGEWPLENIVEYLLDVTRADDVLGRTEQEIRAFEQKGQESWVLVRSAGLEEKGLDPAVKDLLNGVVDPSRHTTGRLYTLAEGVSNLKPDQRAQFVRHLVWYSDRPEVTALLGEIFLKEDPLARVPVRMAFLEAIKSDTTGETIDAFETVFSRLPLEVMEQVFHRLLGSINENERLRELLQGVTESIHRELASEGGSKRLSGRESSAGTARDRALSGEAALLPATLEEVNEVLFQEIEAGAQGHWREGWQRQGPSLALALEHAFVFAIVRKGAEVQSLDEVLEGFLYGRLNEVARERVWLSRSEHPPELPTERAEIEDGFSKFYGLIAHRLLTRRTIRVGRETEFPSKEAEEVHRLFLSLRHALRDISSRTKNRFLRHRVLERLVELEDDYASYLLSLANFQREDHRFIETAQNALEELQREFQVKRGLGRFRVETRRRFGLLEPPSAAGLEEPLVEGGQVVLNRVAGWLKDKLNALRAGDPSLPEVDLVLIHGSAAYLSDDQNRLPVAVLNNRDLIGDLDITATLKSPVSFDDAQRFRRFYEGQEAAILADLKKNLAVFGAEFSGKMDGFIRSDLFPEVLRRDAEFFLESHGSDVDRHVGSEMIRSAWLSSERWNSTEYTLLDVVKRYLELEQLAGDLAYYRHYRNRLIAAADPAAEAVTILDEALKTGRRDALIQALDNQPQQTLGRIQKRMEDRLVGLEPTESEQAASWVGEVLGVQGPMPELVRGRLMAGDEIIWGRGAPGAVMPTLARLIRINEDSPRAHNIRRDRTIYVEEGFLPEETVEGLSAFGTVVKINPDQSTSWVSLIMAQSQEKKESEGSDAPKDLIVVRTGSELETGLAQALEQRPESWDFPLAVVAVPAALVSQISARDLTLYLLDILTKADPIAQRRMERLESIRDTGTELQLLSTRA